MAWQAQRPCFRCQWWWAAPRTWSTCMSPRHPPSRARPLCSSCCWPPPSSPAAPAGPSTSTPGGGGCCLSLCGGPRAPLRPTSARCLLPYSARCVCLPCLARCSAPSCPPPPAAPAFRLPTHCALPPACSEAEELAFFSTFNQAVATLVETLGVRALQLHDYHGPWCGWVHGGGVVWVVRVGVRCGGGRVFPFLLCPATANVLRTAYLPPPAWCRCAITDVPAPSDHQRCTRNAGGA